MHAPHLPFSSTLQQNIELIKHFMGYSSDFIVRSFSLSSEQQCAIFFLDGMANIQTLQDHIIAPLLTFSINERLTSRVVKNQIISAGEPKWAQSIEDAIDHIITGSALLLLDGDSNGILLSIPGWEDRAVSESQTQSSIRGPQNSFTETLRTNTTLVRRIVKDTRLRVEGLEIGEQTKTSVSVMFIQGIADKKLVRHISNQLKQASTARVLEGQYIEELLMQKKQFTVFPIFYNSDRPDMIAAGILDGKIALFIDGTPFVLLLPAFFSDFLHTADDHYQSYIFSNAIRFLRYIALLICLLAPSIYITLTTYHQDLLPTQLLLSLAAQREGVPFPAFIEALIMEVSFEILREAGLRMPRAVGQAVSIVGTIVIGQAAVEASIVSAVMVIVVAITAISSFAVPSYSMALSFRLIRFGFMGMAALCGAYGLVIGILLLIVHLASLKPFGYSYLSPIAPYMKQHQEDAIWRFPIRSSTKKGE